MRQLCRGLSERRSDVWLSCGGLIERGLWLSCGIAAGRDVRRIR